MMPRFGNRWGESGSVGRFGQTPYRVLHLTDFGGVRTENKVADAKPEQPAPNLCR
jgi:hypothetical protein